MHRSLTALTAALVASLAQAEDTAPLPPAIDAEAPQAETIRQRDDAGRVRVARQVRQNAAGDYVNHGTWRSWDADGQLLGQGRYTWGQPTGAWSRWAAVDESPLLEAEPFNQFTGPFLSQSNYRDGKLDGRWSIFDADGRLVSEVEFQSGKRHGKAVLMTADGRIHSRRRFEHGLPVGKLEEQAATGELLVTATFEDGRRVIERVERHEAGGLKLKESWLGAAHRRVEPDDPWRLRLARYEALGEELRHGRREAWWPNGQRKLSAEYHLGQAIGTARWWHANGQLALEGSYEEGLATGRWSWWRQSGVRAATCQYQAGKPSDWSLWAADGRRIPTQQGTQLAIKPGTTLQR